MLVLPSEFLSSLVIILYLAAELIFHRKVNKSNTRRHQGVDEPHCVQPGLELGGHHSHENLPAEGLDTVLALHTFSYALCGYDGGQNEAKICY